MRPMPVIACVLLALAAQAHEMRPSYLEMKQTGPSEFDVLWKTPMTGEARPAIDPELSGPVTTIGPVTTRTPEGASVKTWKMRTPGLRGQSVRIRGLESTMTDVLVRVTFADGTGWTGRLTPQHPAAQIPGAGTAWEVAGVYLVMGIGHILYGFDHLLFVFGLLVLVSDRWMLVRTVTAFTIAHSISLAAAALGAVQVPSPPLEASIALSILFLGPEIFRMQRGETSLTIRHPWLVAFAFGLLHGLAFASALTTAGLPRAAVPLALLAFNIGVEIGQLAFVAAVLLAWAALRTSSMRWPSWVASVPGYAVGSLGAFWTIQRTVLMLQGAFTRRLQL